MQQNSEMSIRRLNDKLPHPKLFLIGFSLVIGIFLAVWVVTILLVDFVSYFSAVLFEVLLFDVGLVSDYFLGFIAGRILLSIGLIEVCLFKVEVVLSGMGGLGAILSLLLLCIFKYKFYN